MVWPRRTFGPVVRHVLEAAVQPADGDRGGVGNAPRRRCNQPRTHRASFPIPRVRSIGRPAATLMPPPVYGSSGRGACGASSAPSCVVRSNGSPDRGAGRAGGLLTPRLRHEHAAAARSRAAGCSQPAPLADPRRVGGASAGVGGSPWACRRQGWAGGPKEPPARGGGADPREVVDGAGGHRVDHQIARVVLRVDSRVAAVSGLSRGRRFSRRCASGTAGRSHADVLSPSGADGTTGLGTGGTPGDRLTRFALGAGCLLRPQRAVSARRLRWAVLDVEVAHLGLVVEVVVGHVGSWGGGVITMRPNEIRGGRRGQPVVDVMGQCEPGGDGRVDVDGFQCELPAASGVLHFARHRSPSSKLRT